jgi:hypothetical protein
MSIFFGAFLMAATACSGVASPSRNPVFLCKVDGIKSKAGKLNKDSICNQFKHEIDQALDMKTLSSPVEEGSNIAGANWVLADIKIENKSIISATISRSENGKLKQWPAIFVAVSDADIDARNFQHLAEASKKLIGSENQKSIKH